MSIQLFQQLQDQLQQEAVVTATVIRGTGSVPREVGAKMLIWASGDTAGTIGGGAGEAKVIRAALVTLKTGQPQRVEIDLSGAVHRATQGVCGGYMQVWLVRWSGMAALKRSCEIVDALSNVNQLSSPYLVWPMADGIVASTAALPYIIDDQVLGTMPDFDGQRLEQPAIATLSQLTQTVSAFIEPLCPEPTVLIIGAGHVGIALAHAAHFAGFRIAVQDERPEWANPERFPPDTQILQGAIADVLACFPLSTDSYVALVTRGYAYDVAALQAILAHHTQLPVRYLGMIGSRKRSQIVCQTLREGGIAESVIQAIHAPIGLDIGALTPAEIAISIVAEMIQIRRMNKMSVFQHVQVQERA